MINSRLYEESFPFVLPLLPSLPSATVFPLYFLCDLTLDLFYTRLTLMCVDFAGGQQAVDGGGRAPHQGFKLHASLGIHNIKIHTRTLKEVELV